MNAEFFRNFLNALREGAERLLSFIGKVFQVVILAYPFRWLWNEFVSELITLPKIVHIDHAIAILSLVAICGLVFRRNRFSFVNFSRPES